MVTVDSQQTGPTFPRQWYFTAGTATDGRRGDKEKEKSEETEGRGEGRGRWRETDRDQQRERHTHTKRERERERERERLCHSFTQINAVRKSVKINTDTEH